MELEEAKFGNASAYWAEDLEILTGEKLGTKSEPWRGWWSRNRETFKPDPGIAEKLHQVRLTREIVGREHLSVQATQGQLISSYVRHSLLSKIALLAYFLAPLCFVIVRFSGVARSCRS